MNTGIEANQKIDDPSVDQFIDAYVKILIGNNAAVFAGAGLSMSVGYVDWQGLLSPIARSIGLDSAKEHDLVALAQYHFNEKQQNRHALTEALVENFSKTTCRTKNHEILCQLPIDTYWTTNYDKLIEKSLEDFNHILDVKRDPTDITINVPKKTATVYKMHGDVNIPAKTIITKDEYLQYPRDHAAFLTALQYDLSRKSFLFIGFSFSDPNLESVLNTVRLVHGQNSRPHYAFFKSVSLKDYYDEEKLKTMPENKTADLKKYAENELAYQKIKQSLVIKDLLRFNINAVMVNEYSDITRILERLYQRYKEGAGHVAKNKRYANTVYISGYTDAYGDFRDADVFLEKLTIALLDGDCMIISDRTPGVGINILSTAAQYVCHKGYKSISDYIVSTPPLNFTDKDDLYRAKKSLIKRSKFVIFLFGSHNNVPNEIAPVMDEEFLDAEYHKLIMIPIGATGFSARIIWQRVVEQLRNKNDLRMLSLIGLLGDNKIPADEIIRTVMEIISLHNSTNDSPSG